MQLLKDKIAIVAGATRGAGRGIACMLGEAGATVYCTGRSSRNNATNVRPETIEETAEMVTAAGGKGIPVVLDHRDEAAVKLFFEGFTKEVGRVDILVNDIWGGDDLLEWGKKFWELDMNKGFQMMQTAIHTHLITSKYAVPLMIQQQNGLVVEITDGDGFFYRGNLFYDLIKTTIIRLAFSMSEELKKEHIHAVAVTPGFLRSEAMLDLFGVREENWQEGTKRDPNFIASETPYFVGRAVAALAADPNIASKSGRVFSSWDLSTTFGFTDIDGNSPHWGNYVKQHIPKYDYKKLDDEFYSYCKLLGGITLGDVNAWE
ncbi:NAD(P)-dependent dehydrogenase (short-subunit alcohol dehydrogenase family) [Chitinophaga skermanii]|uniref:NAD(P)-dependent dehydrogenase (Short-subunit alcohol dehydrogenase family) n=1 Tax=Chitinophaga skermanii TaxID=331697 RepID=A0A327Q3A8_9BACT|nr:SDR family oxidoreductase [Chitinophaga skermanii]RAI98513.1 NAD(P)-dependent dehydrogenase (short-subunit alcohol dehydrogenase family) [Chitinophaga skermanii]